MVSDLQAIDTRNSIFEVDFTSQTSFLGHNINAQTRCQEEIAKSLTSPIVYILGCECFPYLTFSTGDCSSGQNLIQFQASKPSTVYCEKRTPPETSRATIRIDEAHAAPHCFIVRHFLRMRFSALNSHGSRTNFHFHGFSGIITQVATYNRETKLLVRVR